MIRFDPVLVNDACGNPDVLMKEREGGLFVRYEDYLAAVRRIQIGMDGELRDAARDARDSAAEAYWQGKQGEDYGTY